MKRVGIYNVGTDVIDIVGFGIITGTKDIMHDDLGIEVSSTVVKLDNDNEIYVTDSIIGDEDIIRKDIDTYRAKGYIININK